jgi:Flp pilus assembly protein TadG
VEVCRSRSPQRPTSPFAKKPEQQGFVLIATSIAVMLLIGLAGLGIDIGRMYLIRAELQSFTDAAALTAALALDGTAADPARARTDAQRLAEGPHAMRWDMGTKPIENIATTVSEAQPGRPLVRVVATEPAPIIFLRVFQPFSSTTVAATSVATKDGQSVRLVE